MCVFKDEHLGLGLYKWDILPKRLIPPLYQPLTVALHSGMGPCEISSKHFVMPTGFVIIHILLGQQYCLNFIGTAPLCARKQYPGPLALRINTCPLLRWSLIFKCKVVL